MTYINVALLRPNYRGVFTGAIFRMMTRRTLLAAGLSITAAGVVGYSLWPKLDKYHQELELQRQLLFKDHSLLDLIRMATLAANGHNSQPWKFQLNENRVRILPDMSRRTIVVDPDDHHLYVSLGCAAENLVVAARAHGRSANVIIEGATEPHIDIALGAGPSRDSALYKAIPLRQSTRSVYDGRPISIEDINLLKAAAQQDRVSVLFFTEPAKRDAISEFVVEGNSAQMDDPAFIEELRAWLRFSPEKAIALGDGLFSACSGNPVAPEWIGRYLFKAFFTKDAENAKYRDHIRSSAGIAVFIGDQADPLHWIKVGRSFERFALQATALGIRNAHINQPIEVPSIRAEFAGWLGMPDVRPDLVVRFGRAPALPMSLRMPVADVLI